MLVMGFIALNFMEIKDIKYVTFYNMKTVRPPMFNNKTIVRHNEDNDTTVSVLEDIKDPVPKCQRMNLKVNYTKPSIAFNLGQGRTANQLCYFATGYALWKQYGILNFIEETSIDLLSETFDLPQLDGNEDNSPYYLWTNGNHLILIGIMHLWTKPCLNKIIS